MYKIASCLIIALAASGCATQPPVQQVTAQQIAKFQKGVTTEADVIAALGKPMTVSSTMDGRTLAYASVKSAVRGSTYVPVVGLFTGGVDMKINSAAFVFDAAGKLKDYSLSDSAYSANALGQREPARE
jgi:outer membrane protein assembly factor BamE (lipoprotein component of BamABCDE complex)